MDDDNSVQRNSGQWRLMEQTLANQKARVVCESFYGAASVEVILGDGFHRSVAISFRV